jgi:16S rRNA (guanine(527)-N(7))-methyltransferase RsmG
MRQAGGGASRDSKRSRSRRVQSEGGGRGVEDRRGSKPRHRPPIAKILEAQGWATLRPLLIGSDTEVDAVIGRLQRFSQLLIEWNRQVSNLISRNDESRLLERHLRESLEPARWMMDTGAQRWIDFGSGAGLPAIPLAIAGVGKHWTLVESRRPKVLFMRKILQDIGLSGLEVVHSRLEEVVRSGSYRAAFDGFTSRATMRLGPTLEMASELVRRDGHAFLWKGSRRESEMSQHPNWETTWEFDRAIEIGNGTEIAKFLRKL